MPLPQAPSYLTQSAKPAINDVARQGVGTSMPPHISIQGNVFTLYDAANNEYNGGPVIQAVVVDVGDVTGKMYYGGKAWTPDSNDAPVCWSTNGIGPSIEAAEPQARTCAECPMNVRGSAVSKISGASIKACRDETHLALMFPTAPQMIFRLVITPGSFKNWGAYIDSIKGVALQDLVTQFEFAPKENGVLQFSAPAYIPQETLTWREQAYLEKKTDSIVGRGDRPRGLPAPAQQEQLTQQVQQPAPFQTALPAAAQPAPTPSALSPSPSAISTLPSPTASPDGGATSASPSEARPRRRRAATETLPATAPAAAAAPVAPFRPAPAPAGNAAPAAAANPTFGIGQGTPPNAELAGMLGQLFPQAAQR